MGIDLDAVAHHGVRHVQVFDELGEPGFEVEPVAQDQVRLGSFADIAGGGLVAVDFGPGLGDGLDPELVPRHVLGDVGQHSERCEHHGFVITSRGGIPATGGDPQGKGDDGQDSSETADIFGAPKRKVRHTEKCSQARATRQS